MYLSSENPAHILVKGLTAPETLKFGCGYRLDRSFAVVRPTGGFFYGILRCQ
jgi:hypothetical protein